MPLHRFRHDAPLKAHAAYRAAKAGDAEAAARVVIDLGMELVTEAERRFAPGMRYVAPHAIEAAGDNAIPAVLAAAMASLCRGVRDDDITQANQVWHTGADPMERLISPASFDGPVCRDAPYVLVDDVLTMGGTLAELADYIHHGGGRIAGVVVLVFASRTGQLAVPQSRVRQLEGRYGDEIRSVCKAAPASLTGDEAQYLIGFRTADELRNRAAKAAEERDRRLRARGVRTGEG
ncbi:phosphoribosyltransferase [Roseomonas stagni]|uniref:Phosphoribosyltransferase n=1 Tax=Falsiroseomonas algicola TaxID=2716930 RepID=A0A6M1LV12_9PROT|nr:phosphoribosyltransferase [Falsiroseomonas algicola]NGM24037.1 phosphoribosyltransferase [Falsiroseomonas algicola]